MVRFGLSVFKTPNKLVGSGNIYGFTCFKLNSFKYQLFIFLIVVETQLERSRVLM